MRYVIAYDIADDRRRLRVSKRLESVGERVQGSVFEADLDDRALERLMGQLKKLIDEAADGVRFYRLCGECVRVVRVVGQSKVVAEPGLRIV